MIIFGMQGKRKLLELDPGHTLIFVYRYFHIFWIARLAFGGRYELATMTDYGWASRPVSPEEAKQMGGPATPKKSLWDQWSLPGLVLLFLIITGISSALHA